MNQGACAVPVNDMTTTNAISILENQQNTLDGMLNALEGILYGNTAKSAENATSKPDGIEGRLTSIVASNEKAINRLDRLISRL